MALNYWFGASLFLREICTVLLLGVLLAHNNKPVAFSLGLVLSESRLLCRLCQFINSDYSIESDTIPLSLPPCEVCADLGSLLCSNTPFPCCCWNLSLRVPIAVTLSDGPNVLTWGLAWRFWSPAVGALSNLMWTEYRKLLWFEICWHSSLWLAHW